MGRVLIVDDSAVIRQLLTEYLSEQGHLVDTAIDGVEGLTKAKNGVYDLCICDIHLPKKNGYQLLTELGDDRRDMQFIFTDSLPDELYERIQNATGFICLRKPFDLEQLRAVVDRSIEKSRAV